MQAAAPKRLQGLDIGHVQFFHGIRNKLYHQGDGITVPTENTKRYAELTVELLKALLDVDLATQLRQPELENALQRQVQDVQKALSRFREQVSLVVEEMELRLLAPGFVRYLAEIAGQQGKEPVDFGEMLYDITEQYGISQDHMELAVDYFYDWQRTGQRSSYMPPDLTDPYTIYLKFMESVLCKNDPVLWEELEGVLDYYWTATEYIALASPAAFVPISAQIEIGRQTVAQLEAARALLPNWLSKKGETEGEPPTA